MNYPIINSQYCVVKNTENSIPEIINYPNCCSCRENEHVRPLMEIAPWNNRNVYLKRSWNSDSGTFSIKFRPKETNFVGCTLITILIDLLSLSLKKDFQRKYDVDFYRCKVDLHFLSKCDALRECCTEDKFGKKFIDVVITAWKYVNGGHEEVCLKIVGLTKIH